MSDKEKRFVVRARNWARKHGLFGTQGFFRYVMFLFIETLAKVSNDFVFKGGNLLWMYIKTPRATPPNTIIPSIRYVEISLIDLHTS